MKYLMCGSLLITCFYAFSGLIQASKLPYGLFGQDLGKMISRENITEILKAPDRSRLFGFKPTFQDFSIKLYSQHSLQITPVTGKIISIWATSKRENTEQCKEAQKVVVDMIRKNFSIDETARKFHRGMVYENRVMAAACMGMKKDGFLLEKEEY